MSYRDNIVDRFMRNYNTNSETNNVWAQNKYQRNACKNNLRNESNCINHNGSNQLYAQGLFNNRPIFNSSTCGGGLTTRNSY
jgi:hypothetical protein